MFCKNCGKQLPNNSHYCPNCGSKFEPKMKELRQKNQKPRYAIFQYKRAVFFICIIFYIFVTIVILWKKSSPPRNNSDKLESVKTVTTEAAYESQPVTEKGKDGDIVGTWKCEQGEVTFTEKGHMMMGRKGIVLGDGWLNYEVVDDSTLYLSGGDIPVGINMRYEIDGDFLGLELNGETIMFSKEK